MTPQIESSPLIEQGNPASNPRAFRRALSQFATGVAVVTTSHEGRSIGMAVNSFTSISLEPPLVAWSIRKESANLNDFIQSGHYSISVLASDQLQLSRVFGSRQEDKFEGVECTSSVDGAPLITGAIAHFECVDVTALEGGDHLILLGRVDRYARSGGAPLLFSQGQYAASLAHPDLIEEAESEDALEPSGASVVELLKNASVATATAFECDVQSLGVTVVMARVVRALGGQDLTLYELELATAFGTGALQDALAGLQESGRVSAVGSAYALTGEGQRLRQMLATEAEQFTRHRLKGLSAEDVEAALRVLETLAAS